MTRAWLFSNKAVRKPNDSRVMMPASSALKSEDHIVPSQSLLSTYPPTSTSLDETLSDSPTSPSKSHQSSSILPDPPFNLRPMSTPSASRLTFPMNLACPDLLRSSSSRCLASRASSSASRVLRSSSRLSALDCIAASFLARSASSSALLWVLSSGGDR